MGSGRARRHRQTGRDGGVGRGSGPFELAGRGQPACPEPPASCLLTLEPGRDNRPE